MTARLRAYLRQRTDLQKGFDRGYLAGLAVIAVALLLQRRHPLSR